MSRQEKDTTLVCVTLAILITIIIAILIVRYIHKLSKSERTPSANERITARSSSQITENVSGRNSEGDHKEPLKSDLNYAPKNIISRPFILESSSLPSIEGSTQSRGSPALTKGDIPDVQMIELMDSQYPVINTEFPTLPTTSTSSIQSYKNELAVSMKESGRRSHGPTLSYGLIDKSTGKLMFT